MGTFGGHILPGTFFIAFAMWWSFMTTLRYIQCRNRNASNKASNRKYTTSVTMPCICCPYRIQKLPLESIIKLVFAIVGIFGEVITGIKIHDKPEIILSQNQQMPQESHSEHNHVHKRDTSLPAVQISTWHFEGVNGQHSTMYAAFAIGAIVEILIHYKIHVPQRLEYITGIMAFGVEALLFQFHLHGRDEIDIHIHVLLIIAVYACVISCILEFINPHNVLFTYCRILFTFLQGTWFYQAGFILYPPFKSLENRWDANNHMHIMFVTMSYVWHILLIFLALLAQFLILNHFYGTKYTLVDDIENVDDSQQLEYLMLDNKNLHVNGDTKAGNVNETSLTNTLSDDESEIEFDNSKLINNSHSPNNSSSIKSGSSDRKR